ncbi:MAG: hypothetical protein JWN52_7831 [Actinomycetia bacterium]|nr:hypothetical protein [Actinomycetes bacterium]
MHISIRLAMIVSSLALAAGSVFAGGTATATPVGANTTTAAPQSAAAGLPDPHGRDEDPTGMAVTTGLAVTTNR